MQFLQFLSVVVTAIATLVIGLFSYRTYQVYTSIREIMSRSQTETRDLYEAIVIATLVSAPSFEKAINNFSSRYKGDTKLFDK